MKIYDTLVIGAGMSGISAARYLQEQGLSVVLLDKGSRPGGRMACRPIHGQLIDHGAQYFSAESEEFKAALNPLIANKSIKPWFKLDDQKKERYISPDGMNSVPKALASNLEIIQQEKVLQIEAISEGYKANDISAKSLILTPPVPQTLEILENSGVKLANYNELAALKYDPCIALLVVTKLKYQLGNSLYMRETDPSKLISWITDNGNKLEGDYLPGSALTIHLSPSGSSKMLSWEKADISSHVLNHLELKPEEVLDVFVHKWRYSIPVKPLSCGFIPLEPLDKALIAGEIFCGSKVEGAFLSGLASGKEIAAQLS